MGQSGVGNIKLRARIAAIKELASMYPELKKIILWGTIPEECKEDFHSLKNEAFQKMGIDGDKFNKPLNFTELTSFNTWYHIHPEKVAGKELITTSRNFPVTIKGAKEDVLAMFSQALKIKHKKSPGIEKRIRIAKTKAIAKLKLLELLKI